MLVIKKGIGKPPMWRLVLEIVLLFLISSGLVYTYYQINRQPTINRVTIKAPTPDKITSNILLTGNIYWGRYINDWSMASPLKYGYPFSRLNEFHRDQYDAWVAGLECPIVAGVSMSSATEDETLQFNCSPNYLTEAAKWFSAVGLANNHTDNQGSDGFLETRQQLEKAGIQYFGHYDPDVVDDDCEVIGLPVTIQNSDKSTDTGKLPVAFCGFHGVFKIPSAAAIASIQKYSEYMPVIAMPHMGAEYKASADELKTSVYRSMIDNGADMVVGDHPHWLQNSESYNGHLILYSMGNFIFDQQDNVEVTRSAALNVLMSDTSDSAKNIAKWLAVGQHCSTFKDDCLQMAKDQNLKKLTIDYKFAIVGSNDAGKIVKPAEADQQASILQRLNWQTTINGLQAPYGSL